MKHTRFNKLVKYIRRTRKRIRRKKTKHYEAQVNGGVYSEGHGGDCKEGDSDFFNIQQLELHLSKMKHKERMMESCFEVESIEQSIPVGPPKCTSLDTIPVLPESLETQVLPQYQGMNDEILTSFNHVEVVKSGVSDINFELTTDEDVNRALDLLHSIVKVGRAQLIFI